MFNILTAFDAILNRRKPNMAVSYLEPPYCIFRHYHTRVIKMNPTSSHLPKSIAFAQKRSFKHIHTYTEKTYFLGSYIVFSIFFGISLLCLSAFVLYSRFYCCSCQINIFHFIFISVG